MSKFQILSLVIFFKRGCLPWKGDFKNHYCHVLRCKTRSDIYHSGKQIHPMLRNHSNFLGIEDINPGKATGFFSREKKTKQTHPKDSHKRIKPSLPHTLWVQLHHLWTLLPLILWNCRENHSTDSSSRIIYNLQSTQCFINCYGIGAYQFPATAFYFLNAAWQSLLQFCRLLTWAEKSGNNQEDRKTDWVSFWPRKMTY